MGWLILVAVAWVVGLVFTWALCRAAAERDDLS